jgi:pantoate--beta-alanine ligase
MSLNVIHTIADMQSASNALRREGKTIACVPTMGYLHEGHASLIREAAKHHDIIITTIFVNPMQFGPQEDFERYPRNPERDIEIIASSGGNYVFMPSVDEMYPSDFQTTISIGNISKPFEGIYRPGHFEGVATVVAKLFGATKPDTAFFGQKDYQQTLVIKQLVKDLNMGIDICVNPTLRESSGLAMSSRNVYLSPEEKKSALVLQSALKIGLSSIEQGNRNRVDIEHAMLTELSRMKEFQVQYCNAAMGATLELPDEFEKTDEIVLLIAGFLGKTRLIDNMLYPGNSV